MTLVLLLLVYSELFLRVCFLREVDEDCRVVEKENNKDAEKLQGKIIIKGELGFK